MKIIFFIFNIFVMGMGSSVYAKSVSLKEFEKEINNCLNSENLDCFKKFIQKKMYFPEKNEFGCRTKKKEPWYINPEEFVACMKTSQKKYKCGDSKNRLLDAIKSCFQNKKSKYYPKYEYYETPSGVMCHIEKNKESFYVSSVSCGC